MTTVKDSSSSSSGQGLKYNQRTCQRCQASSRDNPQLHFIDYTDRGRLIWNCYGCYKIVCAEYGRKDRAS